MTEVIQWIAGSASVAAIVLSSIIPLFLSARSMRRYRKAINNINIAIVKSDLEASINRISLAIEKDKISEIHTEELKKTIDHLERRLAVIHGQLSAGELRKYYLSTTEKPLEQLSPLIFKLTEETQDIEDSANSSVHTRPDGGAV